MMYKLYKIKYKTLRLLRSLAKFWGNLVKWFIYKVATSRMEYMRATQADRMCSFMWEFQQYLRGQVKYAAEPDDVYDIYDKWFEMMNEEGVDLESIY